MSEVTWSRTYKSNFNETAQIRLYITGATASGSKVRLRVQSGSTGALSITGLSIGQRDGTTANYKSSPAPVRVTFSGNNGVEIPAGGQVLSDWVNFNFDHTVDHLVHVVHSGQIRYRDIDYRWITTSMDPDLTMELEFPYSGGGYTGTMNQIEVDSLVAQAMYHYRRMRT